MGMAVSHTNMPPVAWYFLLFVMGIVGLFGIVYVTNNSALGLAICSLQKCETSSSSSPSCCLLHSMIMMMTMAVVVMVVVVMGRMPGYRPFDEEDPWRSVD
jgi:hypothetical protein